MALVKTERKLVVRDAGRNSKRRGWRCRSRLITCISSIVSREFEGSSKWRPGTLSKATEGIFITALLDAFLREMDAKV